MDTKSIRKNIFPLIKTVMVDGISYDVDVDILAGIYGGTQSKRKSACAGR